MSAAERAAYQVAVWVGRRAGWIWTAAGRTSRTYTKRKTQFWSNRPGTRRGQIKPTKLWNK